LKIKILRCYFSINISLDRLLCGKGSVGIGTKVVFIEYLRDSSAASGELQIEEFSGKALRCRGLAINPLSIAVIIYQ